MKGIANLKSYLLVILFLISGTSSYSQTNKKSDKDSVGFITPDIIGLEEEIIWDGPTEIQPCFPGGYDSIGIWIKNHTIYPDSALKMKLNGKVYVSILVNEEGKIISAQVVKGVHKLLNDEALRVVSSIPFTCGATQNGVRVKVTLIAPVIFKIPTN